MKKLLNTLYITTEDAYLSLDGECVVINYSDSTSKIIPLHTLDSIVSFTYKGASPALIGKCVKDGIYVAFYSPQGKYLYSVCDEVNGNVYLRREQYRIADNKAQSLKFAKNFIIGKLYNSKYVVSRYLRDHPLQVDCEKINRVVSNLKGSIRSAVLSESLDELMGIEGRAAVEYFSVFSEMILVNKDTFRFEKRTRRPATDPTNALLSFSYTLLSIDCSAALRGVGLDPYVGFMHCDRSGRKSLGLDLVEELRPAFADRFVLMLINNRLFRSSDFQKKEDNEVVLTDEGRQKFLQEWQKRKREEIKHPYLHEKIKWGLIPHVQALLLARTIRGDLDEYPVFFI